MTPTTLSRMTGLFRMEGVIDGDTILVVAFRPLTLAMAVHMEWACTVYNALEAVASRGPLRMGE